MGGTKSKHDIIDQQLFGRYFAPDLRKWNVSTKKIWLWELLTEYYRQKDEDTFREVLREAEARYSNRGDF